MKIKIKPALYSKAKTVEDIKYHISSFPKQDCNSSESYKHTIEFVQANGCDSSVGTLSEFSKLKYDEFVIQLRDGLVRVKKNENNEFIIVNTF